MQFLESKGIRSHFSTPKEQWQNGAAESTINSIMMTARTVMAESGLGGRFWFKTAAAGKDARNVTYKERIGMSPYQAMYGEKKDVSDFRAFGCRAWVHLDKQRRQNGKHTPRAKEAIYVGFTENMSAWTFYIPEDRKIMTTNQSGFPKMNFLSGVGRWLINFCQTIRLTYCTNMLPMSSGNPTTSCTWPTIRGSIMTQRVMWSSCKL